MTETNLPDKSLLQASFTRTESQKTNGGPADPNLDPNKDLVESLEWLLGSEDAIFASDEEREERRERRKDLLLWLLHLEPRLAPYGENQGG